MLPNSGKWKMAHRWSTRASQFIARFPDSQANLVDLSAKAPPPGTEFQGNWEGCNKLRCALGAPESLPTFRNAGFIRQPGSVNIFVAWLQITTRFRMILGSPQLAQSCTALVGVVFCLYPAPREWTPSKLCATSNLRRAW
jgi:hypothetical protein